MLKVRSVSRRSGREVGQNVLESIGKPISQVAFHREAAIARRERNMESDRHDVEIEFGPDKPIPFGN